MKLDEILYQIIPKPIADQIRDGEPPANTWRDARVVSVLFAQIVNVAPNEMMHVADSLFATYDKLCEMHLVHKVGEDGRVILLPYVVCTSVGFLALCISQHQPNHFLPYR